MSPADYGLTPARCLNRFARGETSVVISAANSQQAIQAVNHPDVLQNIGVAPVPGVPWFGGANLIIWKEVRMNLDQERAAIELAKYLTTPAAQVRLANANNSIPTRAAALSQLAYPIPAFQNAVERSVQAGRSYPQVRLWVRIMNELVNVFDAITAEVIEKPDDPVEQILQRRLKPLSNRLNMMLS
jgi:ABC-type glycerol-3-phosphate transport system substrate-binding protein